MELDDSALCMQCNPQAKERGMFLVFKYADGTTTKGRLYSNQDFYVLKALLEGKLSTGYGHEDDAVPLKDRAKHLRFLLGLPKAEEKKE
jgi:hypothetical protein